MNFVVAGFYDNLIKNEEKKSNKPLLMRNQSETSITISKLGLRVKGPKEESPSLKQPQKNSWLMLDYLKSFAKSETFNRLVVNLQHSTIFEYLSYFLIIIDTLILSVDSNARTKDELKILLCLDFMCLIYFFIEITIRMLIQRNKYFKNLTNLIDVFIFILNVSVLIYLKTKNVDIFTDFDSDYYTTYSIIRAIQIARIYRILISKKLWRGIAIMAMEIIKILTEVMNFLIILCICLLIMSLVGRDLFARASMVEGLDNKLIEEEIHRMNLNNILRAMMTNFMVFFDEDWHLIMINHMKAYGSGYMAYFILNVLLSTMFLNKFFLALLINKLIESKNMKNLIQSSNPFKISSKLELFYNSFLEKLYDKCWKEKKGYNKSKYIKFEVYEQFKKYIKDFMHQYSKGFDKFMFIICCFSLLLVALNDPFQPLDSVYNRTLKLLDIPVLIIFLFEILFLSLTEQKGLLQGKTIFRLGICVVYIIYFISDIHILKIFVTLRFILIIQFYKGLRKATMALLYSLWDIFQLLVFFFLFILLFAVIGVKLHKGAFTRCQNLSEEDLEKIQTTTDCFDFGGDWINPDFNFDNIFKAIDTLFVIANSSGWLPLM